MEKRWRKGCDVGFWTRRSSGRLKSRRAQKMTELRSGRKDGQTDDQCVRLDPRQSFEGQSLGRQKATLWTHANILQSRSPAARTLPRRASRRPWSSPPRPSLVPRPRLPRSPTPRPSSRSAAPSTSTPSSSTTLRRPRSSSSRSPPDSRLRSSRPRPPPKRSKFFPSISLDGHIRLGEF